MTQKEKFEYFRAFVVHKIKNGGTKQNALAAEIGCSGTTIHHLVKGTRNKFKLNWQKKVAAFFGLTLAELIHTGQVILQENQHVETLIEEMPKTVQAADVKNGKKPEIHIHIHLGDNAEHVVCA